MRGRKRRNVKRRVVDGAAIPDRAASGSVVVRDRAAGTVRRGGGSGVRVLAFAGALSALYLIVGSYRAEIAASLPEAYPILKALGYEVEEPAGYGLRVQVTATRYPDENRQWSVYVRGSIVNTLDRSVSVPPLRLTVESSNARPFAWTIEPERSLLPPGERIEIRSRYATPFALRDIRVRARFEKR